MKLNKNISLLISSRIISDIGNWVDRIAVLTLVHQISGAATSMSLVSIASILPCIALSPFAGKFVDQHNKKKILIVGDLLRAVLVLLIPFFQNLTIFFLFLISIVSTFTDICNDTIVPFLSDESQLKHINSISASLSSAIMVIGPSLSGVLIAFVDIKMCFVLDSLSFLISALLVFKITYQHKAVSEFKKDQNKTAFRDILVYIKNSPKILSVTVTVAAVSLAAGMLNSLLIIYVYDYLGQDSAGYGLLLSVKGIAMMTASVMLYKIIEKVSYEKLFTVSLLGLGISLVLFPLNSVFSLALLIQAINGISNAGYSVARVTILQLKVKQDLLGRVFSVNTLISNVLSVASLGVFGVLADIVGVRIVLLIGGVIVSFASMISFVLFHKAEQDQEVIHS